MCYGLVKHILMYKWWSAYFKMEWRWPSAVTDISMCLGYACFMHCRVWCHCPSPTWHYKDITFPWMMTDYNSSGTDRKCCYCKNAKYGFQQRSSRHGSQKPGQKVSPVIQQNQSLLSTTNVHAQAAISHKDNTILKILQELRFPFCGVEVNARIYREHVEPTCSCTEFCINTN